MSNKHALCLFGLPPMECNKHIKVLKDFSESCWKKNVLNINNIDIFIHAWGNSDTEKLEKKYNPVRIKIEKSIMFDNEDPRKYDYPNCTTTNMFYSQAYSAKKSIELKKEYEKNKGFKYNIVMMSRIDCLWLNKVIFNELNPNTFYVSNWNQQRKGTGISDLGSKSNITTISRSYRKILDYWFISGSENIDTFGNLFDYIPEWIEKNKKTKMSNHTLKKDFLVHTGLWNHVSFKFFEHYDHNVQRYFYKFKDHKKDIFKSITRE